VTDARTRKGVHGVQAKYQNQDYLTAKVELKGLDYNEAKHRVKPKLTSPRAESCGQGH